MKLGLAAQTKIMAVAKEKADGGGSLASSPLPLVYELASLNADKVRVGLSDACPAYCDCLRERLRSGCHSPWQL